MKDEFIGYLEMSKHFCLSVKNMINSEEYIDAAYALGQLHSALDFKLDELEDEDEDEDEQMKK